jgi:hypothetical protein
MIDPDRPTDADPRPWEQPGAVRRDVAPHRGNLLLLLAVAGLVCGLLSFVLWFPGVFGILLGVTSVDLAGRDLLAMDAGTMDPSGREQATRARAYGQWAAGCGSIGLLLFPLFVSALTAL